MQLILESQLNESFKPNTNRVKQIYQMIKKFITKLIDALKDSVRLFFKKFIDRFNIMTEELKSNSLRNKLKMIEASGSETVEFFEEKLREIVTQAQGEPVLLLIDFKEFEEMTKEHMHRVDELFKISNAFRDMRILNNSEFRQDTFNSIIELSKDITTIRPENVERRYERKAIDLVNVKTYLSHIKYYMGKMAKVSKHIDISVTKFGQRLNDSLKKAANTENLYDVDKDALKELTEFINKKLEVNIYKSIISTYNEAMIQYNDGVNYIDIATKLTLESDKFDIDTAVAEAKKRGRGMY